MAFVWLNDKFVDDNDASVSVRDAGLLHGAGLFTTLRGHAGRIFRLERHLRRLRDSSEALFIPLQHSDDALSKAAVELLARNELADARIRITVTRGAVTQDPLHGMKVEPNVFITAAPFEPYPMEYYQRGLTVVLLDEQKLNPYDVQAGHKTLNYFPRLSAMREATRRGAAEALWFNVHNYLQSASISNVFIVENGRLITPPTPEELRDPAVAQSLNYPRSNALPGITRAAVIELAQEAGIEVELGGIDVSRVLDAQEIFLTNSIMQVMPVHRIERKTIGNDLPGEMTLRLANLFRERFELETNPSSKG